MICDTYSICESEFISIVRDGFPFAEPPLVVQSGSEAQGLCEGLLQAQGAVVRQGVAVVVFDHR